MKLKAIILNEKDHVAVALQPLSQGETIVIGGTSIKLKQSIPQGHKFAVKMITKGEKVLKDGEVIGLAIREISVGEHVHVHNLRSMYGK